jgi:NACHT domain
MTTGSPPPSPESRFVAKVANALIQWTPVGGGGGLLIHFLLRQDWILSLLMFPVMLVTVVWAKYTENFIETFGASAGERGASDARSLSQSLARLNKDLQWRFSRADDKYRRAQANACRYYLVEGVGKNRWNPATMLEEVYVPLKLSGRLSLGFHQGDFEEMAQSGGGAELAKENAKAKPQYIWDLLRQVKQQPEYRQMAIIAPGGFGKTTMLRHVTYRYSYQPHRICREKKVPRLIPVLLYLRECRDVIAGANTPDLPTLIAQHHVPKLSTSKLAELDVDWAKKLLSGGKALVMIDGFDEVAADQCEVVSQWIDRAIADYGTTATFILTTRPAGHDRYEGQQPLKLVKVEKFSDEQRDQFLQRWYLCQIKNERLGHDLDGAEDEADREAADLIEQIERRSELADMADNPLLLCMMATYHKNNPARSLPLARHRLYQGFCQMLLADRPLSKKMAIMLPAEESQAVLQRVALDMVQRDCIALSVEEMTQLVERCVGECLESAILQTFCP